MRFLVILGLLGCLFGCAGSDRAERNSAARPSPAAVSEPVRGRTQVRPGLREALVVLHGWDQRRAEAWARQDAPGLSRLYVPGSMAGAADVDLLRAYTRRGLVVRRLETQLLEGEVLHDGEHRLRLRVRDRVAGGLVSAEDGTRPLGSTPASDRVVELRRRAGVWRVASVRDLPGRSQ